MPESTIHQTLSLLLAAAAGIAFSCRRLLQYLRFLQQEEYKSARFVRWINENGMFDRKGSTLAFLGWAGVAVSRKLGTPVLGHLIGLAVALALTWLGRAEPDPRVAGKIRLNMTERAKRIYRTALYCMAGTIVALALLWSCLGLSGSSFWLVQVAMIQSTPFWLVLAVRLLQPGEDARQRAFLDEAKEKIRAVNPYIIGITGSYGKTSTKAVLGKMLDVALGPTFWPEKGINTPMGITREIREKLTAAHKYAVIEMGAYHIGSIARLCELTPPKAGIVTAVGLMHLERFGGAENVFQAKSELARALPADGLLVCNGDNEGARRMAAENPKKTTLLYGMEPERGALDIVMSDIRFGVEGSHFVIHWQSKAYPGFTPLHGRPALSNILGSFAMAAALGADPEYLIGAMANLKPVSNRLEVKAERDGYVQINDAYNSNPEGFAAALEVLEALPAQRRILITPGMIELGDEQARENERIAQIAGRICDLVFLVGAVNRDALKAGLVKGGTAESAIRIFEDRNNALAELGRIRKNGDAVLIENDLPDLFEIDIRL